MSSRWSRAATYRFTVKVGKPKDARRRERDEARARGELSVSDVGYADQVRLHQS